MALPRKPFREKQVGQSVCSDFVKRRKNGVKADSNSNHDEQSLGNRGSLCDTDICKIL